MEAPAYNPLADIRQYSQTLTISQLLKFCEKKGLPVTKAMIQNYIRLGLLPPPVNKRFYTHNHLAALAVIESLKRVRSFEQIKEIMKPHMANDGLPLEVYEGLVGKLEEAVKEWNEKVEPLLGSRLAAALFASEMV